MNLTPELQVEILLKDYELLVSQIGSLGTLLIALIAGFGGLGITVLFNREKWCCKAVGHIAAVAALILLCLAVTNIIQITSLRHEMVRVRYTLTKIANQKLQPTVETPVESGKEQGTVNEL
ncbi:MAG: hypothetical protein K9N10_22870 [Deltaproteobacteria bacterium]|nr:hypothetical protein [Deltaproteobacteria bacterium]